MVTPENILLLHSKYVIKMSTGPLRIFFKKIDIMCFRFVTYMESTMPIIDQFRSKGLVREITANKDVNAVYTEVKSKCEF